MELGPNDNRVYAVPVIDVNWLVFAPFDPGRGFRVDPPNVRQSLIDLKIVMSELKNLTDGKYVLTPHSGTYCRSEYYEGDILGLYQEAVAGGADVGVHLHEEIKGVGTRFAEMDHVTAMFLACKQKLEAAGVRPVAYRGGHYAYHPAMNKLLEDNEIFVDYSCCPKLDFPDREAIWTEAGYTADLLPDNLRRPWPSQRRSRILEVPIGSDGLGTAYANILHIEQSEIDNLERVWDAVVARAEAQHAPQIVHFLFHTASVGEEKWLKRFRQFLDMVPRRRGQFISSAEAQMLFRDTVREMVQ